MLNEKNIRQALDRRLSGLTASEERRNAILQAARQERREDKPVRSKKTLVIAIALILAMLCGQALAVSGDITTKSAKAYADAAMTKYVGTMTQSS